MGGRPKVYTKKEVETPTKEGGGQIAAPSKWEKSTAVNTTKTYGKK